MTYMNMAYLGNTFDLREVYNYSESSFSALDIVVECIAQNNS